MRDRFNQIPNSAELQDIIAAEAKRDLPPGKEEQHYFDFSPFVRLLEQTGVSAEDIARDYSASEIVEQDLLAKGRFLVEKLKSELLGKEPSTETVSACNAAYDYLAEEDVPESADIMFVFGAKTPLRIEKAIELYHRGISPLIVVSGRSPHYSNDQHIPEADVYARIAIEKGVPADAVLLEDQSITIPDNVRSSLNLLDAKGISYQSILLVNSPYTQRRGWAHFRKYLPDTIRLVRVNSGTKDQYTRDAWYKNSAGIDTVTSEYVKAKIAVSLNTA
ncbi:MAG TPA: YdcF family protein [Candidatus Paceibacterota bacterium]